MSDLPLTRVTDLGDTAFNVEFGDAIDPATNARVTALCRAMRATQAEGRLGGLVEVVPTFRSLMVRYDPLLTSRAVLEEAVLALAASCGGETAARGVLWRIPVCYDDDLGPDLAEFGLPREEVIALHSHAEYVVYMLGFMPGFAYMGGVPEALRIPRKATPRLKVPAGSVAVADALAAVYPWDSPGGWHLLGRTPVVFFDLARSRPSLLAAGDRVRFTPISRAEFDAACADPSLVAPQRLLAEKEP